MQMSYTVSKETLHSAIRLYQEGCSAQEVKDTLEITHSTRQIQRWMKKAGIIRPIGDAYRNAAKRGRIKWAFKENKIKRKHISPKLRYETLERDNFQCVKCSSKNILEVDHIDENKNNNVKENLQTLCHECNIGKSLSRRFP